MIRNKRILVTGGAGFIGTSIVGQLINHNAVIVYDNLSRSSLQFRPDLESHSNFQLVKGDVLDLVSLTEAMRGADIVIHAAGITGIDTVIKNPIHTMRVNMFGTANMLEAARHVGVTHRILNFSSSEVFGPMAFKSGENDPAITGVAGQARWAYAVSKLAGEHLAQGYLREHDLPIVVLRPFNIYGPGQYGEGALQIFVRQALAGKEIHINGDGSQIRAWCYIDDFVDCFLRCLESPAAVGESFNIGNSRAIITILGLANMVCRILSSGSTIVHDPQLSADIQIRIPTVEKAQRLLGFTAQIDLEEGIRRTATYFREHQ